MKLLDLVNAPWAMSPGAFATVQAVAARHFRGETADLAAIEARMGRPLVNDRRPIDVVDGVAVIALDGVLGKRMNMLMAMSGGTSMEIAAQEVQQALDSPAVHSIVLGVDSPGGTVDGTIALADAVRAASARKPVVTVADGTMASAAYWIGVAAGRGNVFVSNTTTQVGSIGVLQRHVDVSGAEAQRGVKTTEVTAGKYKRAASEYRPLDAEGRAVMQADVDYVYSLFVDSVAKDRGVSSARVLERMADGRVFRGKQAIAAGLVDGEMTVEQAIARLAKAHATKTPFAAAAPQQQEATVSRLRYSENEMRAVYDRTPGLAAKHGSFEAFVQAMETAATPSAPVQSQAQVEKVAQTERVKAHAKAKGMSFVEAFKDLGLTYSVGGA